MSLDTSRYFLDKVSHKMSGNNSPHVAIVLPFLNEQTLLGITCRSLGFGTGVTSTPENTTLVLIDNASIDDSLRVAEEVRQMSLKGSVMIGKEAEHGYVPARDRGVLLANAKLSALRSESMILLQADADTIYQPGYVSAMRSAAAKVGPDTLLEARTSYPKEFAKQHPAYIRLCTEVDQTVEKWFVPFESDVIVDDKVAGFFLTDYFAWGRHQREYSPAGDEIYAETSRLYLRAKERGALRHRVDSAIAEPSMRRLLDEPSLHFATGGFPREASWNHSWRKGYTGPTSLEEFCRETSHPEVQRAIRMRQLHLLALFTVLPVHVNRSRKKDLGVADYDSVMAFLQLVPERDTGELESPGILFTDVFELIESHGKSLLAELNIEELQ